MKNNAKCITIFFSLTYTTIRWEWQQQKIQFSKQPYEFQENQSKEKYAHTHTHITQQVNSPSWLYDKCDITRLVCLHFRRFEFFGMEKINGYLILIAATVSWLYLNARRGNHCAVASVYCFDLNIARSSFNCQLHTPHAPEPLSHTHNSHHVFFVCCYMHLVPDHMEPSKNWRPM